MRKDKLSAKNKELIEFYSIPEGILEEIQKLHQREKGKYVTKNDVVNGIFKEYFENIDKVIRQMEYHLHLVRSKQTSFKKQ